MKISFKNNISSFTQQDMGLPTFLDWLHSIEIIPKHTFRRKHKDRSYQWDLGYLIVNPNLYLIFFIREKGQYGKTKKNNNYSKENITIDIDQDPIN